MIACFKSAESGCPVRARLNLHNCLTDDGVYLCDIFLYIALRNLKQAALSLLKQVVDIIAFVVCLALYVSGKGNQLARKVFLRHNPRVILDIGTAQHP